MSLLCLKHVYSVLFVLIWRPMPPAACSRLCSRIWLEQVYYGFNYIGFDMISQLIESSLSADLDWLRDENCWSSKHLEPMSSTMQHKGSRNVALKVVTHGQKVAPIREVLPTLQSCPQHILQPQLTRGFSFRKVFRSIYIYICACIHVDR